MSNSTSRDRLQRLGNGETIDAICQADGMDRAAFDAWWAAECERRLPAQDGEARLPVDAEVEILRDARGVPHIRAANDRDLFTGYGFAMAQDRLFQMDLRRRRTTGRVAEAIGPLGIDLDVIARTLDLPGLASGEYSRLPAETRDLFEAFSRGVNAAMSAAADADALSIEFDLLGYAPEPWTAEDCVRCVMSWRFQLTGRPWVVSVPELAKRILGEGPLYDAFLAFQREADDASIVPAGEGTARDVGLIPLESVSGGSASTNARVPVGAGASAFVGRADRAGPFEPMGGSNNWVVAGTRSRSGKPILAGDPHMPYEASSSFYEVHLSGGSFACAGAGLVGYPGLTFGRNRHLAWSITNNICSQRDLYLVPERAVTSEREEAIAVRGRAEPIRITVQVTAQGPIIDRLMPAAAAPSGPVAMRWVGQLACDWPSAQLRLNRAESVDAAMTAVQGWLSPTFSLMLADDDGPNGHIAFTNTGTIPVRGRVERGFRDAANPADAWQGLIPPAGMPQVRDPSAGWLGSANNRPAGDDFPYPLSGTWDEGLRHRRIGQLVEELGPHGVDTFARMHADVHLGRADDHLADMLTVLEGELDGENLDLLDLLRDWDGDAAADSAGAALFEVFWMRWVQAVSAVRFPAESADFVAGWMNGFAARLVSRDEVGWFDSDEDRREALADAFLEAAGELRAALGANPAEWRWGALHHKGFRHPLTTIGDLGPLLDQPIREASGGPTTLANSGVAGTRIPAADASYARNWDGASGAGYRFVADLGDPNGSIWTITAEGQSAHPGSDNRADQLDDFLAGRYQEIPLDRERAASGARHRLHLRPVASPPSPATAR